MAKKETPLMTQYNQIKAKYPDAVLLFRVGDFYETFGEDAIRTSKVLNIVLTKRANGSASHIELAGFPHHSLESYLPKLVRAGLRVAICEQLEDPKMAKGIVKRGVTELITPGVTFNENVLESGENNFLAAIHQQKDNFGIALLDVSTGEFLLAEGSAERLLHIIDTFTPKEILALRGAELPFALRKKQIFRMEDWAFQHDFAYEKLTSQFGTESLKGFGVEQAKLAITAAGAIMVYLTDDTHHTLLKHISKVALLPQDETLTIDPFSIRNLEMISSSQADGLSLLSIIDRCKTPMGHRMLRRRLLLPLKSELEIKRRLSAVAYLAKEDFLRDFLREQLGRISDIERLTGKLASEKISPKELGILRDSCILSEKIKKELHLHHDFGAWIEPLEHLTPIISLLQSRLNEELPVSVAKGNVIRSGCNKELDELRDIQLHAKDYLNSIVTREIELTGITSLKIDFNNVFGYYIEVRNTHKDRVPEEWIRKQTLANAERYITPELKEYEQKILGAEEKISMLELAEYRKLCQELIPYLPLLQQNAGILAELDCAAGLAELSIHENYTHPEICQEKSIEISQGRHPVIEKALPLGEKYVPNDVYLDPESQQIIMVTGPNMAGKSALLRQTALICILAQMGSFVPAKYAKIGILDRIFTRVGASDNISAGESTFMVEMNEAASILNNFSDRSLILLDELGRGTSTYDGVSIAWAIAEYLHEHPFRPKVLFATHYHELNEMEESFGRIKNFHVSIKEHKGRIIFLRHLVKGGNEHSFGIHVAKLAGMPKTVTQRAEQILKSLENARPKNSEKTPSPIPSSDHMQLSFFQLDDPVLESIREELEKLDINTLTPVEALMKLHAIQKMIGK